MESPPRGGAEIRGQRVPGSSSNGERGRSLSKHARAPQLQETETVITHDEVVGAFGWLFGLVRERAEPEDLPHSRTFDKILQAWEAARANFQDQLLANARQSLELSIINRAIRKRNLQNKRLRARCSEWRELALLYESEDRGNDVDDTRIDELRTSLKITVDGKLQAVRI